MTTSLNRKLYQEDVYYEGEYDKDSLPYHS